MSYKSGFQFIRMTINNRIEQLPTEQLSWLLLTKNIFDRIQSSNSKDKKEFINIIEHKAVHKGYREISILFKTNDLEQFFF